MKSALGLLLNVEALGVLGNYLSLLNAKTQMEQVNRVFNHGLDEDDRVEQEWHTSSKTASNSINLEPI